MKATCLVINAVLIFSLARSTRGEVIFQDEVSNELSAAVQNIAAGEDRGYSVARLRQAIKNHPQSPHVDRAMRLANDLAESIFRADAGARAGKTADEAPAEFLSETRLPLYLVSYDQNRVALNHYVRWHSRDPAVLLLAQGRNCVDQLLLHLDDDSPTRINVEYFRDVPDVPRVSDVARNLIETVSGCRFLRPGSPPANRDEEINQRPKLIEHITRWWRENKGKSIAAGIRAQIPYGDGYSGLTMAENLIRVAGETNPQDREYALDVMRRIARVADYTGAPAAEALAKYGDLSPVEWYYSEFKGWLNTPGRIWGNSIHAMFYLTDHGGRKEWELLCAIAAHDIESAKAGRAWGRHSSILGSLINARKAQTSPYAIPLLGMALRDTEMSGSRWVNEKIGGQSFSKADKATEYLQQQTGVEFGYRADGTKGERIAAIQRAQKWWAEKGEAQYTFDYIERNMAKPGQ